MYSLFWPWLNYKSTSLESKPFDCISQDVRVKLLHLDCNTELTVSLLLLGKLWDMSSIIQKRCLPTTHLLMCISACASVNTFREIMKTSSFCFQINQFRPIGPPPSHPILLWALPSPASANLQTYKIACLILFSLHILFTFGLVLP